MCPIGIGYFRISEKISAMKSYALIAFANVLGPLGKLTVANTP